MASIKCDRKSALSFELNKFADRPIVTPKLIHTSIPIIH